MYVVTLLLHFYFQVDLCTVFQIYVVDTRMSVEYVELEALKHFIYPSKLNDL